MRYATIEKSRYRYRYALMRVKIVNCSILIMLECYCLQFCGINLRVQKMIVLDYPSKKVLKENIGKPLRYIETSMFGPEYRENGTLTGANRPHITGQGREFFAIVKLENGLIVSVK